MPEPISSTSQQQPTQAEAELSMAKNILEIYQSRDDVYDAAVKWYNIVKQNNPASATQLARTPGPSAIPLLEDLNHSAVENVVKAVKEEAQKQQIDLDEIYAQFTGYGGFCKLHTKRGIKVVRKLIEIESILDIEKVGYVLDSLAALLNPAVRKANIEQLSEVSEKRIHIL